jgi:predicted DNA-binding transcriptional regulator AlpA
MEPKTDPIDYVRPRKHAAKILGISVRTLRRMEQRGEAPARVRITDRIVGYRDSAIVTFLNSRPVA